MPSSVSADFSLWKTRINVWKRTSYLFRRISLLRCWEFRTRWFSNLGLYTFSWFKLYWRQFSITRSVLLSIYSLKTWINVCNRVKSSFSTLFLRFILGFLFLLNKFLGLQLQRLFFRTYHLFTVEAYRCVLRVMVISSRSSWRFQPKNGGRVGFIFQRTRNPWLKCFLY